MCTIPGSKNDKVLPLPVSAIPIKSCPERTIGKAIFIFNFIFFT
jgi:hypothetical protein